MKIRTAIKHPRPMFLSTEFRAGADPTVWKGGCPGYGALYGPEDVTLNGVPQFAQKWALAAFINPQLGHFISLIRLRVRQPFGSTSLDS